MPVNQGLEEEVEGMAIDGNEDEEEESDLGAIESEQVEVPIQRSAMRRSQVTTEHGINAIAVGRTQNAEHYEADYETDTA